jgi:hypothetical protein
MTPRLLAVTVFLGLAACSEYDLAGDPTNGDPVSDDPTGDADTAIADGAVSDAFVVPDRTDVVVFGDTSSSMAEELLTMGQNVTRFVDRLAEQGSDWQLMAVTGPDGCNQDGILTIDTPDFAGKFAQGIMTPPGPDLVDEWGLNNAMAAIQDSAPGKCNEGFLRDGALLHVIFISDEDDNSPNYEQGGDYWRPYVDAIRAEKGDGNVKFSAVGGPLPNGCDGAEPAHGYAEATAASEGLFISICDDWAAQIPMLADISTSETTFTLTKAAIPDSIEVFVDDQPRASGWTYDPQTNVVEFTRGAPIAGQEVRFEYETLDI